MKRTFLTVVTLMMFGLSVSPLMAHDRAIVVQLKGKANAFLRNVPAPDGGQINNVLCFKVPMFDVSTGKKLGVAFDCLSDVVMDGDGGVTLTDTTIFKFKRKRRGKLVSYGRVSIRPLQDTESAPISTHITGSVPAPGTKNIISRSGTKQFKGRSGIVRLSGAVNMSEFNLNPGEPIDFNCLFVIKLDGKRRQ
ncbi:MAG: hypothetical protein NPIRA05_09610 [Nitrospirales bacterium]|nr:MAG: hypothetical protein NPIRA05_09610 [Nitrospirales bacterium]